MSKQRIPLTPLQLGLTLLNGAGLIFCAAGDLIMLMFDRGTVNRWLIIANLAMALLTVAVCGAFVQKAEDIDMFDEDEQGDRLPAVEALRTFFCMIASDMTLVLMLMLAGMLVQRDTVKLIAVFAPLLFIAAGMVYYFRVRGYGSDIPEAPTEEPENTDREKADLMKAADEIIAEEHKPRTAEDILADIKADMAVEELDEAMASVFDKKKTTNTSTETHNEEKSFTGMLSYNSAPPSADTDVQLREQGRL